MRALNRHLIGLVTVTTIACGFSVGNAHDADKPVERACAIAYWGLAMSNRPNPFVPPDQKSLARGWEAVQKGQALGTGTSREKDYLDALAPYFKDYETIEQRTRTLNYEQAMRALAGTHPEDDEAQIFFALALTETALMNAVMTGDTSLDRQIEAGEILERVWRVVRWKPPIATATSPRPHRTPCTCHLIPTQRWACGRSRSTPMWPRWLPPG